jgi:cell division protein FtsQ
MSPKLQARRPDRPRVPARGGPVSWTSLPRFAARARARRRLALRPALVAVLFLASMLGLAYLVYLSPVLAVTRVDIVGEARLTTADVVGAARVPHGRQLARLDTDEVRKRVEALPAIRSADVRRRPPGTVRITVIERVAAAVVRSRGGYRLVDDQGIAFASARSRPRGLPLIETGPAGATPRTLGRAAAVFRALPPGLERRLTAVRADSPDSISLTFRGGTLVVWGGPERSAGKAEVLAALMRHQARVYDVSAPDAPTTRG